MTANPTTGLNAAGHFVDRHVVEGRGQQIAYVDDRGSYSYAALAERVNRAGNLLKSEGLLPEQRVLIALYDSIDFVAFFWGAIKIGAVPVALNTLLASSDYGFMLRDSRAALLIVQDDLLERFRPVMTEAVALTRTIIVGKVPNSIPPVSELLARQSPELTAAATQPDDVAFWLYTSGSTGSPKGAMHVHADLIDTAQLYGEKHLGVRPDDVVFSAAKLFFAYGLGNGMSFPLHAGATAVLMAERPTPQSVTRVMSAHNPSIFFGVPTLFAAILADPSIERRHLGNRLRLCVSAGEALPPEIYHRWQERFGVEIIDGLGSTEMLHIFLSNQAGAARPGTSGRPVAGYELKLVDEDGNTLQTGEIGELMVKGPTAAIGYWNNRAKSRATFVGEWTRTGDKYLRDADGYYHYSGRSDDMLKVSGIWVSPFEVESALITHPAVQEAAVIGVEDKDQLVKPKAYVVLKPGQSPGEPLAEALQNHVKSLLAPYKYPRWISFVTDLPKTATGKTQRFRLRQLDQRNQE